MCLGLRPLETLKVLCPNWTLISLPCFHQELTSSWVDVGALGFPQQEKNVLTDESKMCPKQGVECGAAQAHGQTGIVWMKVTGEIKDTHYSVLIQ